MGTLTFTNNQNFMNTIDFTEKEEKQRSNIAMSGICLLRSIRHMALAIADLAVWCHERVIKRYPLIVVTVVIIASVLVSMVQIGKARAERDSLAEKLYAANQRIEKIGG